MITPLLTCLLIGLLPALAGAVDCDVPSGSYPTVQGAIDDPACTTVNLGDQSYAESLLINRSLAIVGPAALADIAGHVEVQGAGTVVEMTNLMVDNGCTPEALLVTDGGQVDTTRLEVVWTDGGPCPPSTTNHLFSDGFEAGNHDLWSGAAP